MPVTPDAAPLDEIEDDADIDYPEAGSLENFVADRPLAALAVAFVLGFVAAKTIF
jgi:hypothetical protein